MTGDTTPRDRIEDLVRKATLAFYDDARRAEMSSDIDVDYLTQDGDGHKLMVFAQSHEYEHEREVWAEVGDLTIDLEPEKVGSSSYHVHVTITNSGDEEGGFEFGGESTPVE